MPGEWHFEIMIDPASIGTAQQKKFDPRTRRFFTHPKVARSMRMIALVARLALQRRAKAVPPKGSPVFLELDFYYAAPASRQSATEGSPCTARWAGDCDNRAKAVIDALTRAGLWSDDQFVTKLVVTKRWTREMPRISVTVAEDD